MDDRLRLLKRIRTACRVAQWLLLGAAIVWLVHVGFDFAYASMNAGEQISNGKYTLQRALWDYMDQVRNDLALLPPPAAAAAEGAWLDSLRAHFGSQAGIFLLTPQGLDWRKLPVGMAPETARLAELVADSGTKVFMRTAGFLPVRRVQVSSLKADFDTTVTAVIAGDPTARQWGVLYRHSDLWQPIAAQLNRAVNNREPGKIPDPLAERLSTALHIDPPLPKHPEAAFEPTFRVIQNSDVLFASPGLDTASRERAEMDTIFGARVEFFYRQQDVDMIHLLTRVWLWVGILWLAVLFTLFELIFRWAGRLRKSEPAPAAVEA